ncbi:MAG: type IX secretion system sortase PorU [Bacteroidales bacterium]|jgi:hypothetical protein|nr:type IX secretion system sortase PorU [Bacteroidales bacterium]
MRLLTYIFIFIVSIPNIFAQSVLGSGTWAQVRVEKSGVYKISYDDLINMGFSNIETVSIYANTPHELSLINTNTLPTTLTEIPVYISQSNPNTFSSGDYILFYGQSAHSWELDTNTQIFIPHTHSYSNFNYYFITINQGQTKRIVTENQVSNPANYTHTDFIERLYHEKDEVNPIKSGREWFEYFSSKTLSFPSPQHIANKKAHFYIKLAGRDPIQSEFRVIINDSLLDNVELSGTSSYNPYAHSKTIIHSFYPSKNSTSLSINSLKSGTNSRAYLDFVAFQYPRKLEFTNTQFSFRSLTNINTLAVSQFNIASNSKISVWDISNPLEPKNIQTSFANNITSFKSETNYLKEFIAFNTDFLNVHFVKNIQNQDILSRTNVEMIIITPEIFHEYADTLAKMHLQQDNIRTIIITPQEIFNEFSSGKPDIGALRNFVRYVYTTSNTLKYLLLFGDGSYDNRNFEESSYYIPTYQSQESLSQYSSFVSDDFFGILEENEGVDENDDFIGDLDIAVGRFPVNSKEEAKNVVHKTIQYSTNKEYRGEWQNNLCFIADDADENQTFHMSDADNISKSIHASYPQFNSTKIYLDAYKQEKQSVGQRYPDANLAIDNAVKKGCLVFNYTGHGSETQLSAENALNKSIVSSWNNTSKLPLFITASCEVSRFDDETQTTLGEHLLLERKGGAIALFSTTRVVFAFSNYILNKNIYKTLFLHDSITGKPLTIGESFVRAKHITPNDFNQNKRSFTLLGDPALTLAVPQYTIVVDSINNIVFDEFNDTLKAKSIHTISGHIQDFFGNKVDSYNGEVYLQLFDKEQTIKTLGNDGNNSFEFSAFTNILFHGKANIINGDFKTPFIIPQDIFYYYGKGKLSLYATNGSIQANGVYSNLPIFGTDLYAKTDTEGPEINIYMNDTLFKENQKTHENPRLFVKIYDPSGINISQASIGHDITVTLENIHTSTTLMLNDFYIADNNTFASGTLEYPFTDLEPGNYTLTIEVWDTYNNSSIETMDFIVTSQEKIKISSLYNYPNPLINETTFRFSHNQADKEIHITIHIYNIRGQLVKTLTHSGFADSFTEESIYWDGKTNAGNIIEKGIYPYTLILKTEDGLQTITSQKILVYNK